MEEKQTSTIKEAVEMYLAYLKESDLVLKLKNGKDRAVPTVKKTKRAVRMMFTWAKNSGMIANLPVPKSEIPGNTDSAD